MNTINFINSVKSLNKKYVGRFTYTKSFLQEENLTKDFRRTIIKSFDKSKTILNPFFEKENGKWFFSCIVKGRKK